MSAPRPGTFRSAWRHRGVRSLLTGFAVSSIGDFLCAVALVVYLIDETGSAGWVAASVIGRMATYTLLGPIGGVVADRYDRRSLMIVLDVARAILMGVAAAAIWLDINHVVVIALSLAASALSTAYRPAAVAITPSLAGEDDLAATNAAEATIGGISMFVGPALGAAIVATAGASVAFSANAATFLLSAWFISRIERVQPAATDGDSGEPDEPPTGVIRSIGEGVTAMRTHPGLIALTLLAVAVLFTYGVEQVALVLVVQDRLDLDVSGVGVLSAFVGVGSLMAVPIAARLGTRHGAGRLLALSGVLMGAPLALLAVTSNFAVACALMMIDGFGGIVFEVLLITLLQRACPEALLGRVYALQDTCGSLAMLLGSLAAPLLIAIVSLEAALMVGGGVLVVSAMLLTPALSALSARTEAEQERIAPTVEQLRSLGILGEASQSALERIARSVTIRHAGTGERLITEGDAPDDLFVIVSGRVEASTSANAVLRQMGQGEWFGEIGLLQSIPRTASVDALEPTELMVIPGDVFVDALSNAVLPDPVRRAMDMRLQRTHPHLATTKDHT